MSANSTGRAVRVAVSGLGAVVRNIHLPAYERLRRRVELVAGCDPDPQRRAEFTRATSVPAYDDLGVMLRDSTADIVSICSPPSLHQEQVLAALAAGRHVFCEKPMAESLADADTLIAAAASAQRRLVVNSQFPAMKIHAAAKAVLGRSPLWAAAFPAGDADVSADGENRGGLAQHDAAAGGSRVRRARL